MNEESVKIYEEDMQLFINLSAEAEIMCNKYDVSWETSLYRAAASAFRLVANQMCFRLESLRSDIYSFQSITDRKNYICDRIELLIEEKTNAKKT